MITKWRWDQGRLEYFQFDNIKAIASCLVGMDGVQINAPGADPVGDALMSTTGLTFKKPPDYRVWRNYKRVFECSLLATQAGGRLYVSDICKEIVKVGRTIDVDEYLSIHLPRFRYPFPAFEPETGGLNTVYPFSAVLKFLIAKLQLGHDPSVSHLEVSTTLIGNKCTGQEDLSFYQKLLPTSYSLSGDSLRQIRELLIFMSQLSVLKWDDNRLTLDILGSDDVSIQGLLQLANPVITIVNTLPAQDFMSITALKASTYKPLIIPSRESAVDEIFTEGKRTRVTHIKIERSPLLRRFFLKENPVPICDMCETNTKLRYPWTDNLIEVHHLLPLSSTIKVSSSGTSLRDVIGLCPNCHRSVHSF